jgi:protein-tyrosine phosphatase
LAHALLDQDVVTVIATDGHNNKVRKPVLKEAYDWVASQHGEPRANRLFLDTPQSVIATQPVIPATQPVIPATQPVIPAKAGIQ